MTAYRNYVQDFPNRSRDLLKAFSASARTQNREVTLLFAVATSCLIVPYERLHDEAHPSQDRERFIEAKEILDKELEKECVDSTLWEASEVKAWSYKKMKELRGDPDAWALDRETKPINSKKTKTVLTILRNALAHGNIWTTGNPTTHTLVFVSLVCIDKPKGPYNLLQCSPDAFRQLVMKWVDFLSGLKMPSDVFVQTGFFDDEAA